MPPTRIAEIIRRARSIHETASVHGGNWKASGLPPRRTSGGTTWAISSYSANLQLLSWR